MRAPASLLSALLLSCASAPPAPSSEAPSSEALTTIAAQLQEPEEALDPEQRAEALAKRRALAAQLEAIPEASLSPAEQLQRRQLAWALRRETARLSEPPFAGRPDLLLAHLQALSDHGRAQLPALLRASAQDLNASPEAGPSAQVLRAAAARAGQLRSELASEDEALDRALARYRAALLFRARTAPRAPSPQKLSPEAWSEAVERRGGCPPPPLRALAATRQTARQQLAQRAENRALRAWLHEDVSPPAAGLDARLIAEAQAAGLLAEGPIPNARPPARRVAPADYLARALSWLPGRALLGAAPAASEPAAEAWAMAAAALSLRGRGPALLAWQRLYLLARAEADFALNVQGSPEAEVAAQLSKDALISPARAEEVIRGLRAAPGAGGAAAAALLALDTLLDRPALRALPPAERLLRIARYPGAPACMITPAALQAPAAPRARPGPPPRSPEADRMAEQLFLTHNAITAGLPPVGAGEAAREKALRALLARLNEPPFSQASPALRPALRLLRWDLHRRLELLSSGGWAQRPRALLLRLEAVGNTSPDKPELIRRLTAASRKLRPAQLARAELPDAIAAIDSWLGRLPKPKRAEAEALRGALLRYRSALRRAQTAPQPRQLKTRAWLRRARLRLPCAEDLSSDPAQLDEEIAALKARLRSIAGPRAGEALSAAVERRLDTPRPHERSMRSRLEAALKRIGYPSARAPSTPTERRYSPRAYALAVRRWAGRESHERLLAASLQEEQAKAPLLIGVRGSEAAWQQRISEALLTGPAELLLLQERLRVLLRARVGRRPAGQPAPGTLRLAGIRAPAAWAAELRDEGVEAQRAYLLLRALDLLLARHPEAPGALLAAAGRLLPMPACWIDDPDLLRP